MLKTPLDGTSQVWSCSESSCQSRHRQGGINHPKVKVNDKTPAVGRWAWRSRVGGDAGQVIK
jgi:hypothetical protein